MRILLADAVVLLHVLFVVFVLFGGLLVAKWPRVLWIHGPAFAWGCLVEFNGWLCPLTPLENWLRIQGPVTTATFSHTGFCRCSIPHSPTASRSYWALWCSCLMERSMPGCGGGEGTGPTTSWLNFSGRLIYPRTIFIVTAQPSVLARLS